MNELLGWYGYDKVELRDSEASEIRNYRERRQHVSVLKGDAGWLKCIQYSTVTLDRWRRTEYTSNVVNRSDRLPGADTESLFRFARHILLYICNLAESSRVSYAVTSMVSHCVFVL